MSSGNIFRSKEDLGAMFDDIELPMLYIVDNFVKEINLAAKKLLQFDVKKDFELSFDQFCKTHHCSLIKLINNGQFSNVHEETYILDNEPYIIRWKIAKFQNTNNSSHPNGYLIFGCDISKEKLAIEDLRKAELFYNNILSKLPTNVYWKDKNSVYMGCNDRLASAMGLPSRDAIKGMTDFDFDWEVEGAAESFIAFDEKVMRTKKSLTTEDVFKEADGNLVTVLTNKTPLTDEKGKVIGVLAISVDITDKKKAENDLIKAKEAAEAASRAKSAFLQNMRHDLRTPLTGIVGFARLIESEVTIPTLKEYAGHLVSSSESLLNILNEILDAIRLASGTIPTQKKKFSLKEKLQSIVNLNQSKANEKKLILSLDYDTAIPDYFVSDYKRVQRIILELLANALKFTEKGEVKITAKLEKQDITRPIIKIIVTDTGIGIPENKREEIFGSFSRLHDSHKGIFQGIGLGLTIAQQFIEDLGGEIYVESVEGKGSKFTCVLPLQIALIQNDSDVEKSIDPLLIKVFSPTAAETAASIEAVEAESGAAIRILIVEDSDLAAKVVSAMLRELGCQVDVAKNGHKAIELAKSNTYGLIFMDVGLPDIDGNEVTRTIRDWENQFEQHTPIIGLTAHVEAEDKQICMQAGMDAVLAKPLKPEMAEDLLKAFIPKYAADKKIEEAPKTVFEQLGLPENEEDFFKLPEEPIDFDALAKAAGKGKASSWAKEILPIMAESIESESENIHTAYAEENWEELQKLTHKMKGGALCCGTVRLEKACFYLERYLRAGAEKAELKKALYQQLLKEMAGTVRTINEWMKK